MYAKTSPAAWPGGWAALLLLAGAVGAAPAARASVICVPSDMSLTSAISQANNGAEGSVWEIHIHTGTYQLAADLTFDPAGDKDNKTLIISGGWTGASNQCNSRSVDPSGTIVRGVASTANSVGTGFSFIGNNRRYEIDSVRFENFRSFIINDVTCYAWDICPDTDAVIVDHSEFVNGEILTLEVSDAPRVVFRNNLVAKMHPIHYSGDDITQAPVGFDIHNDEDAPQIAFNTFAAIDCIASDGAVMVNTRQANALFHHNIVQSTSCPHDIYIDTSYGGKTVTPYYNLYLSIGGGVTGNEFDNGNVKNFNPLFVDAAGGNFRLQNGSPAVNQGQTLIDAVQSGFGPSYVDLDGQLRPVGTRFDIGAYESAVNDGAPPVLTVTNTSDDIDDAGSLRHAINVANSQIGSAQRITFAIPGGCPHVILIGSALPDITDPLVIDGYSQPGANPTSDDVDIGSDANVCIVIGPNGGGISHALEVPTGQPDSTRLSVSGLAFGSGFSAFTAAAIELRAGSGHKVTGNVFGGTMPSTGTSIGTLPRSVLLTGTASDATIGGPQNSDRNYIGGNTQNAIVITGTTSGHLIENNYIGIAPNGLAAQANAAEGISATGGHDISIINNTIGASTTGIYLGGASTTGFTIQRNRIGINAAGFGNANQANDIGIQVGGGPGQHVIGDPPAENRQVGTFSNDIRNNRSAGINLATTAGSFVSIRGNRIEANGADGNGLGIDLAALGALPNDAGDGDTGTDSLQNYPMFRGSAPNGATRAVKAVLNTTANQALRVDFYRSPTCPKGATGANATTFVGSVDVNAGVTGILSFTAQVSNSGAPAYLTAMATTTTGNSSELAPCLNEDTIFADSYQPAGL
jgi:hypothetical protein